MENPFDKITIEEFCNKYNYTINYNKERNSYFFDTWIYEVVFLSVLKHIHIHNLKTREKHFSYYNFEGLFNEYSEFNDIKLKLKNTNLFNHFYIILKTDENINLNSICDFNKENINYNKITELEKEIEEIKKLENKEKFSLFDYEIMAEIGDELHFSGFYKNDVVFRFMSNLSEQDGFMSLFFKAMEEALEILKSEDKYNDFLYKLNNIKNQEVYDCSTPFFLDENININNLDNFNLKKITPDEIYLEKNSKLVYKFYDDNNNNVNVFISYINNDDDFHSSFRNSIFFKNKKDANNYLKKTLEKLRTTFFHNNIYL